MLCIHIVYTMNNEQETEIFHVTLMLYFYKATINNRLDMVAVSSCFEFVLDTLIDFLCWFFHFA